VFLFKSSWAFSTELNFSCNWAFSAELNFSCSWAFSAELNFSWVELLQLHLSFSKLSWTSAELSFFSSIELLQMSWTSTELNFFNCSWAFSVVIDLSQLQLNFNFNCEPLWPYTSWTCLRASWTGVFSPKLSGQDQLNWSPEGFNRYLTPLARLRSSLPVRLADRLTDLSGVVQPPREVQPVLVNLTRLCSSLPVRLADRLIVRPGAIQPVLPRKINPTASFEVPPIYTHSYLSPHKRARFELHF
jgi:hypothetical protein